MWSTFDEELENSGRFGLMMHIHLRCASILELTTNEKEVVMIVKVLFNCTKRVKHYRHHFVPAHTLSFIYTTILTYHITWQTVNVLLMKDFKAKMV